MAADSLQTCPAWLQSLDDGEAGFAYASESKCCYASNGVSTSRSAQTCSRSSRIIREC